METTDYDLSGAHISVEIDGGKVTNVLVSSNVFSDFGNFGGFGKKTEA